MNLRPIVNRYPTIVGILVLATLLLLFEEVTGTDLARQYGTTPERIQHAWTALLAGHWDRTTFGVLATLLSALFLHGDIEHLAYNMLFLWAFGALASQHLGKWWALGLFFICGACGNVMQTWLNPNSPIPIIGASGAVCGFEGIYLGLAMRWRLPWPDVWPLAHPIPPMQLAAFAIIGALFDAYSLMNFEQRIAYGAHLGGFFSGVAIATLLTQVYPTPAAFRRV
jgi:rhomboid family protein